MKVKDGDIVEFIGLHWREPQWDFDFPSVILQPVIQYSPNGTYPEALIEDLCIDLCIDADVDVIEQKEITDEDVSEEFDWRGWKISTMKKVAKNRLAGKTDWKSKLAHVTYQKVKFFRKDNEMQYKVIESVEK